MPQRREKGRGRRERMAVVDALSSLTDPALASLAPGDLINELLQRTLVALGADSTAFALAQGDELTVRASAGEGAGDADQALLHRVVVHAEPVMVGDGDAGGSFVGCPVLVEGETRGVVFARADRRHHFSADDVRLIRRTADRLSSGIERAAYDRSERAARDALADTEHRVRTLVEAAPVGILEFDELGRLVRWNRTGAALLDWPRWLPGAEPATDLAPEALAAVRDAIAGRRAEGVRVTLDRPGTRATELSISAAPVTDREGAVDGALLLLDDVTEREQLEHHIRQAQRLDAMASLAGGVAHDFNNMLTVIVGYSDVLLASLDRDDERRASVLAIREAGERATSLTRQLLTIGRRQVLETENLDLAARVKELAPVLQRLVGDDIEVELTTGGGDDGEDLPAVSRVARAELDQVVINLVMNAKDAMPSGGRIVVDATGIELRPRAAAAAGVDPGRYALLTVTDTGLGMPKEILEHCFDPFFTTKPRTKGNGMGLAAVYGTVTQAGGHVAVESGVGQGTTFRLYFPFAAGRKARAAAKATPGAPARRRRSEAKGRVLLVEDEAPVRSLARAVLDEAGHDVTEASSAEDALAKADAAPSPFDVLVTDLVMPGGAGDQLAAELRSRWPALRVVLMSGYGDHSSAIEPDAFLGKPFPFDELARVVGDLVTPQRARPAQKAAAAPKKAAAKKKAAAVKKAAKTVAKKKPA